MTENEQSPDFAQRRLHELEGEVADLKKQLAAFRRDYNGTVIRTFILKTLTGWAEGKAPFEEGVEMDELEAKIRSWREACDLPFKWDDDIAVYRRVVVAGACEQGESDDTRK